jgi:5-methyltetrahydrofolate--homocysteine methyltransferase
MLKGVSPAEVVAALSEGMRIIGERFEAKEYFLSELIMAGEIMKEAQGILKPHFKAGQIKVPGKVVMGTVEGDLHDIGKNIVVSLLQSAGYEVTDLGVNVPSGRFVEAVRKVQPDVLGMSALLRATVPEMGNVINALEKAGLRKKLKIIVGGLPLNEEYAKKLGADFYAEDAWKGVELIRKVVEKS